MADRQIKVLLIEDNPGDVRLIEEMLSEVDGALFDMENACRLSDGLTRIQKGGIDAVLLDLGLPDSAGLDTFEKVHEQAPEMPIVMLTGLDDTELALEGVRMGTQDYLVKGKVDGDLLARTLRYAIERKAAEARIEHLNSVLKAIRNVNQLIVTETERDRLLRKSCDALVDARGYDAVWLGSLEEGERFATVVGSGFPDDVSRFSKHVTSGDHPPCIRDALAEGETVLVLDKSRECGDCFFKDACLGKEALIIRVEYADRFFGLLAVLLAPGVAVNEGEKSLLAEVATDIGLALHNSEITEARKRAEEELLESEEKYKTIYDSSRDAIMILTPEEGFLGGNIAAITMFGCKGEEEFTSKSPADLSPVYQPDGTLSSVGTQQNMAIAMEKGSYFFEWKHKRMDGGEFFATVLLTRVELQGRKILQATVRDITEQKAAEDALLESEKRLRLIAENMPVMLDAFDDKGNIVAWNSECEKVTGFNADEIVGNPKAGKMLYPDPDYKNYIYSMIMEYRSNFRNLEWDITCRDGSVRTILWSNISEKYPITGWYSWAIGIDITGRKVAEDALLESERKYSEFFRTSRDPIFITTKEGRLVESNDALVEVLGYETMDELLKIAVTKHYENPDDRKRFILHTATT
jgi:PAS domain S-box-containing protein